MKYFIPIIILSLVLLGCKADEEEETTTTSELEGTWKTACYTDSDNYSFYFTPTFAGNVLTITDEKHSDTSCATDFRLMEETHTFSMGDAGKFTITLGSTFKKTPQSSTAVTSYDNSSKCGQSGWELNTAKTCSFEENEAGSTVYCLYELSGTTLYIECNNTATPTSIDKGSRNTFTKQ